MSIKHVGLPVLLCWALWGSGVEAAERNVDLDLPVSFEMVLAAAPELVDEYVRLERDIGQLQRLQRDAQRSHRDTLATYNRYMAEADNRYNQTENLRLFRQLDQKKEQEQLRSASQNLFLVQRKLEASMSQLVLLKQQVRLAYIHKHTGGMADDWPLRLADDNLVVLPSQLPGLYAYLVSLGQQPAQLAQALQNPKVMSLLPDHIREQLQFIQQADVTLTAALSRPEIMSVVIANLQPEAVLLQDADDTRVLSVYRTETAFQAVDSSVAPIQLGSYLDAWMTEMNDLVELYDLPMPSRAVVEAAVPVAE
jgi:hypothetical protein